MWRAFDLMVERAMTREVHGGLLQDKQFVQGFIAASIYFSTGLVAERALGLTWAVFLAGGVLFDAMPCSMPASTTMSPQSSTT